MILVLPNGKHSYFGIQSYFIVTR